MNPYIPMKWPIKEILKHPVQFLNALRIDLHLTTAVRLHNRSNKHNEAAAKLLGITTPGNNQLPKDDHLWETIVEVPKGGGKFGFTEWHLWGEMNSPGMNDVLSKLPGKIVLMKSIEQLRTEMYHDVMNASNKMPIIMPGDKTEWIQ